MKNSPNIIGLYVIITASIVSIFYFAKPIEPKTNYMKNQFLSTGINLDFMDTTISPKNDFYRYVNGVWLDSAKIPSDQSVWGSFYQLDKETNKDVLAIMESALNDKEVLRTSDQGKAVSMYECFMDLEHRNKLGINPILPYLKKVNLITSITSLQEYMEETSKYGGGSDFLGVYVSTDKKNSMKHSAYLYGGNLGLPDRDYYLLESFSDIRDKYLLHVSRMFKFLGYQDNICEEYAKIILEFETKIASSKMDKVERRDPSKTYNPRSISEIKAMLPMFDWDKYLYNIGIKPDTIIVSDLNYFKTLGQILDANNISEWQIYFKWGILNSSASMLTEEIEIANWEFYSKTLRGAQKQKPRNERAISSLNWSIGQAIGKLYVAKKFPPEAKANAQEMIDNIIEAFKARIQNLTWMNDDTKIKAIDKLEKITVKIGYPDEWKDYSGLDIIPLSEGGTYFNNRMNQSFWSRKENLDKLNKEVNKEEWYMSPQIVNAYYSPSNNEIVFPAGILQPPFYDFQADPAVNYGGIGAVIGHEISHAFDDSGADYDGDGNLVKWWSDEDFEKFNALGDSLAAQYGKIEVLPNLFINGKFTLGENIGDLGGVNSAYDGLQLFLDKNDTIPDIDGFTQNQRFFISWATIWRIKMREEALRTRIMTDPHSPGMYRGYVPLQNVEAFYQAFDINEGNKMYLKPNERVEIW
tara:strand:- start:540 stop:2624 length:2085 start_codon:yes stop_codon:yes gene_type:complete